MWVRGINETVITADALFNIQRVMNALDSADIDHFLVLLRIEYGDEIVPNDWKEEMEAFVQRKASRFDVTYSNRNILVSNKGCNISGNIQGYMTDRWLTSFF